MVFTQSLTHSLTHSLTYRLVVYLLGEYEFPDPYFSDISADAKDLITKLLVVDPEMRYLSLTHSLT